MATTPYFTLTDSAAVRSKRFKAIGYRPPRRRTDSFGLTLGGKWDKAAGTIIKMYEMILKIPAESTDSLWADYDDFIYFFDLNSPEGSPSDLLTMVDFYGNTKYVKFFESAVPEPLTTQLEGPSAYFTIPVTFVEYTVEAS